jgi:hypothetical protein
MARAPVGTAFTYQGQLKLAGVPVTGEADLKFILYDAETGGAIVDSLGLSFVEVVDGLFTVQLNFAAGAFDGDARWLEIAVEFPSGEGNWTTLSPRQPMTPAPYAIYAANGGSDPLWQAVGPDIYYNDGDVGIGTGDPVERLHVSGGDLRADGEVLLYHDDTLVADTSRVGLGTTWSFRNTQTGGRVAQLGTSSSDGAGYVVLRNASGLTAMIEIDADAEDIQAGDTSGLIRIRSMGGGPGGVLDIANDDGNTTIQALGGDTSDGGTFELFNEAGGGTILLDGDDNNDGAIQLFDAAGNAGVALRADHASSVAGEVSLYNDGGYETVELIAAEGSGNGAQITLRKADGTATVQLDAEYGDDGGAYVELNGGADEPTLRLEGGGASRSDATLRVNNTRAVQGMAGYLTNDSTFATVHIENDGPGETLWLVNDGGGHLIVARTTERWQFWVDGDGITNSRVLRIHGGADLSEGFDVRGLQAGSTDAPASWSGAAQTQTQDRGAAGVTPLPGMVVSIDPENPGQLAVSSESYDRRVAGIISGAGGVNPGMLMGQDGSDAAGDYPVALTGRVYCVCDASSGVIGPGDLLTTSDTPGHAMKVTDHTRAQGAIIGKAMTRLAQGETGLVLVLVSLQ